MPSFTVYEALIHPILPLWRQLVDHALQATSVRKVHLSLKGVGLEHIIQTLERKIAFRAWKDSTALRIPLTSTHILVQKGTIVLMARDMVRNSLVQKGFLITELTPNISQTAARVLQVIIVKQLAWQNRQENVQKDGIV